MSKKEENNAHIKRKVLERSMEQEKAFDLLKQINEKKKINIDDNKYILELEEQNRKKKEEYEAADNLRKKRMEDIRKSIENEIELKRISKKKEIEEDEEYRNLMNQNMKKLYQEEEDKKRRQIEKYEQYRKDLEEQIRDNRRREIEKLRFHTNV